MATCTFSKCTKESIGDSGLCHKHGGRVTSTAVVYSFCLNPENGGTTVNAEFASRAAERLYKKAIDNFMGKGPSGASKAYMVNGVSVSHDTCGAGTGNHASVFFRWAGPIMNIYALGFHPGSDLKKYSLMWYNGDDVNWTRPAS
jgi:hypothetical protein